MYKYEMTTAFKRYNGKKVYRIKALRDFDDVRKGQSGGYVEDYHNLSHEGNCWITNYAVACDAGQVLDNAWALNYAVVKGSAILRGDANIFDNAILQGDAVVKDYVRLYGRVIVGGTLMLTGDLSIGSPEELTAYLEQRRMGDV